MLIVGLGNPGPSYAATRHNAGFLALDAIADKLSTSWQSSSKFKSQVAACTSENQKLILLKPDTYMNLSGQAVSAIKNYYKIDIKDLIVIHDELDLDCGIIRYKIGGSSAGHNGIGSIDSHVGKEYHRIRIGVGRKPGVDAATYVLENFSKSERKVIDGAISFLIANFQLLLSGDIEKFKLECAAFNKC